MSRNPRATGLARRRRWLRGDRLRRLRRHTAEWRVCHQTRHGTTYSPPVTNRAYALNTLDFYQHLAARRIGRRRIERVWLETRPTTSSSHSEWSEANP